MILGTDVLYKMILDGEPSRFKSDGTQEPLFDVEGNDMCVRIKGNSIKLYPLICNTGPDFLIEGVTVDVRLDSIFQHFGGASLFLNSRDTGRIEEIKPYEQLGKELFYIEPYKPYLFKTMEIVNTPSDVMPFAGPRTSMFRSGIIMDMTFTNPGYYGALTFLAFNLTTETITIERGFRIAQIAFSFVSGNVDLYKGVWQGGQKAGSSGTLPARFMDTPKNSDDIS